MADDVSSGAGSAFGSTPVQSAAVSAGSGILSTIFNQYMNRQNMRFQNDINRENWQMQNEYNLPRHQYERYRDAGLSPSAAAQAVAGIDSSAGNVGTVQPSPGNMELDPLATYFKSQNLMLDQRLADAEVSLKEAEAHLKEKEAGRLETLLPYEKEALKAQSDRDASQANLNDQNRKAQQIVNSHLEEMTLADLEMTRESIKLLRKQQTLVVEQSKSEHVKQGLMRAETNLTYAEEQNVRADTNLKREQSANVAADTELKKAQTKGVEEDNFKKEFDNFTIKVLNVDPKEPVMVQWYQGLARGDEQANAVLDNVAKFCDGAIDELSKGAKRHPGISAGIIGYGINKWQHNSLDKMEKITRSVSNLIPFKRGSAIVPSSSGSGSSWFDKPTYSLF